MARKFSRREGILVGIFAVVLVGYLWTDRNEVSPVRKLMQQSARGGEEAKPPVVRMDLLHRTPGEDQGGQRDLFQFSQRPPSRAELIAAAEAERERRRLQKLAEEAQRKEAERRAAEEAQLAAIRATQPPPPPPRPQPPPVTFRFLGYFGPPSAKIAALENGKDTLLAKEGETVLKEFKVVEIRYDSLIVGFTRPEFASDTREVPMSRR